MGSARPTSCLLLGLKKSVVDDTVASLEPTFGAPDFEYVKCHSIEEMKAALLAQEIDHVFIGAGLSTEIRMEATQTILDNSLVTQIHLKNYSAGPTGYTPFIKTILAGVRQAKKGEIQ